MLPSWYPNEKDPLWGNYFIKQAEELNEYADVSMLYVNRVGIREFSNLRKEKITDGYYDKKYSFNFYKETILNYKSLSMDYSFKKYAHAAYKAYKKLILFTGKPDIILVESVLPAGIAAKYISEKENIPYIVHAHSESVMANPIYKKYIDDIIKDANGYMAVNKVMADIIKRRGRKDCIVVPNFIDCKKFNVPRKRKNKDFVLISISNFYKVKALEVLLKAMDIILKDKKNKNIKLNIVGTGEYKDYYQSLSHSLELDNNVKFLGYIDNNKLPEIIADSDVLCVSSSMETFCIPIVEALSSGKPVISTNCNGPREIINKSNGIIVPIRDVNEYAKAILKIKDNYKKYDSKKIKENALKKYDKEVVCKKIISICNDTIKKSGN